MNEETTKENHSLSNPLTLSWRDTTRVILFVNRRAVVRKKFIKYKTHL